MKHSENIDEIDGESCQNELTDSKIELDTELHTAPPMSSCVSGDVSSGERPVWCEGDGDATLSFDKTLHDSIHAGGHQYTGTHTTT